MATYPVSKVKTDDGTEIQVEPDLKAVQTMLSIIDRRARLLGMEQNNINVQMDVSNTTPIRATLAGAVQSDIASQFSPEAEARRLLEIMGSSGVLSKEYVDGILSGAKELEPAPELAELESEE